MCEIAELLIVVIGHAENWALEISENMAKNSIIIRILSKD